MTLSRALENKAVLFGLIIMLALGLDRILRGVVHADWIRSALSLVLAASLWVVVSILAMFLRKRALGKPT